ncbi:Xaa-Pro dipeptidyl-peptidase (X-Pro dipeptidyl-peptidase) (X-prolyl-dipeptidyl aminopeptidase) (X-PDAP) [Streptococcus salivarius JIM8777]|uniref:Xaa-Pro dipeptidyl-peptidase n=1 Tax=Streptococcus salivarius TaxID=1304 RepID=UPI00021465DA|nr:Xaa-Pro dipeptidyl-peptidase [Streptococcus salivarius]CCB96039.1 Xaa-Pro dipeptidyl-peptidase (X-Pro dipeptidyl-peptidase) (X-prolyl-dipeptidyl aminopeptidase) (X-PDAP) [Streptococcus salivarius JIM8777]
MKFNQFSYIPVNPEIACQELRSLGFEVSLNASAKANFEAFVRKHFLFFEDTDLALKNWIADTETDLLTFFQSDRPLTADVFGLVALQMLGFVPNVDFTDSAAFLEEMAFPITFDGSLNNLHQLLATRTQSGNTLIDQLVAQDLIPVSNNYIFFNGKSLATFDTNQLHREVVYVETPVDTDKDGQLDLVKVTILRPDVDFPVPAMMTASPYQQGTNEPASDKLTHKMEGDLLVKPAGEISLSQPEIKAPEVDLTPINPVTKAQERFAHTDTYTLNDYMLARGVASIYVSGVGTFNSEGFMTSGDYQQVLAYKAVIDWLNGRARAFTSRSRQHTITADWASGKVTTTGLSYLGTMSNALATTGVDGLEMVIAEAGISSWYDYYRENGLLVSPGGYPGEDLDTLTEFTYSRALLAGEYLRHQKDYQAYLKELSTAIDRKHGDYSQFWHDRNYVQFADRVKATVVFTHGSQDWNVKPINVYQMFNALPDTLEKHLFFHNGAHVYMNAWQSIDFRESMNALICQKLLGLENGYTLPTLIWQNNQSEQTWEVLDNFGHNNGKNIQLGEAEASIANHYEEETFTKYGKAYQSFKDDLFADKANAITLDFELDQDIQINGRVHLELKVKSSTNRGLISAQVLEMGDKKYLAPIPALKRMNLDNGRLFKEEALRELPFKQAKYRVITKGHLNLQNRKDLLTIEDVTPNEWMTIGLDLQPTIYKLNKGDKLRLVLYTTDFEHTIRDNSDYELTVDLSQSQMTLPY